MRNVVAYLASAIAAAGFVGLLVAVALCIPTAGISAVEFQLMASAFLVFFTVAFVVALGYSTLVGIPAAFLLRRWGRFRLVPMMIAGFLASVVPEAALRLWSFFATNPVEMLESAKSDGFIALGGAVVVMCVFGVLGALAAAVFYRVFQWIVRSKDSGLPPRRERGRRATPEGPSPTPESVGHDLHIATPAE